MSRIHVGTVRGSIAMGANTGGSGRMMDKRPLTPFAKQYDLCDL